MKFSAKLINPIQRRMFLSLLVVSILFVTCKKTTIINNYITNPSTYGTGLVQTPASTYAGIPVATIPTGALPPSFFLKVPSIPFDQGAIQGSCASSASAMAKSILDHTKYNTPYPSDKIIYSPAFLYNQVKLHPSDCSKGSTIWSNLDKIKVQGICKESDMPYNLTNCTTQPTTAQITLASSNKIDKFETVPLNRTAIKQTINAGFPIVVAFFVDNKFYGDYWNSSSMNTIWSAFGTSITDNLGNKIAHASVLYGWDDSKSSFRLLNSWGNGWGNAGSIWVDYSLVENNAVFLEAYKLINPTSATTNNLTVTGDLNFGNTTINTSSTKTIQLVNNSTVSINISSVSITPPFSTNWSSGSIQAGANQAVTITFNPTTVGNASSTLTINSNAANSPTTMAANGVGVQQTTPTKIISLSGNLAYGNVIVGQTSSKTLTISNIGNSPLIVSSISTPQGFSGGYNGTIQAGNSANVTITFSPTSVQAYSGNITVNSDATSGTSTKAVSGTGVTAGPTVTPTLGTYASCPGTNGSVVCSPSISYGQGVVNAKIVGINISTGQIMFELKKCNGTAFNTGGSMHIVYSLCAGGATLGSRTFFAGDVTVQHTITETNMTGTKVYYVYTLQSGSSNNIYYYAQPIIVTY